MRCTVGVHQVVRRGAWGCRAWCVAACWGNSESEHNIRYRTVPIHLARGGRTGGGLSGHREIKREGGISKGSFQHHPHFGESIGAAGFKDRFA